MDLGGAGVSRHLHQLAARGAPYDGIVDEDHPAALEDRRHRIQLHPYPEVPDGLPRLDEGPSDVVVADEPHLQGNPGGLRVADRRDQPRVRHRDHDVGVHSGVFREALASLIRVL